ncbi:MAG: helix-turn-helix domain-containing protein [Parvibaculaceae bacterium]|nr:helix-turn-helix domain-containing protein [Parvibaculaceae bacterium]
MTIKVGVLAIDGCVGLSVHGPIDLFSTANMISRQIDQSEEVFRTYILSPTGDPVHTSSGHQIVAEGSFEMSETLDVLMIPGIGVETLEELTTVLQKNSAFSELLVELAENGATITASCTGTFLLGQSGLLDGKRATTTWWMSDTFRTEFPEVELLDEEILVDEGQLITSAAGASSLDLSLHLINRFAGASLSRLCARFLVVDGGRKSQHLYAVPWHSKTRDPLVEKADAWIRKHKGAAIRVDDLAAHLGVGARTLLRKFQSHAGMTPQSYIQSVRLDQAKQLLEISDATVAQVGADVGFSDENAFRRAFAHRTGVSPTQYRKQFQYS